MNNTSYKTILVNGGAGFIGSHFINQFAIYNLGNSEPVKLEELVQVIGERLDVDPILDRQELPIGDVQQTFADVSRAKSRLDYEPSIRIEEEVGRFVDWYESMVATHGELFS